jgi:two-component system phosphate regulon sensor histidine kinase PhoR
MNNPKLSELGSLIRKHRKTLLSEWRVQVRELPSARHLDVPTLNDHIPLLLEELAQALDDRTGETIAEALLEGTPPEHGAQRVEDGFNIIEVVAEYNILRGCVHDLAERNGLSLQGNAFHILNRVLDGAIGLAVETFASQQALEVKRRRQEYLAFVAHDLRNPLTAISLAAGVLETTLQEQRGDVESAQMIRTLHRNVAQLEALVAKVLEENTDEGTDDATKLERRHFDLWPLVESLVHAIKPVAEEAGTALINLVPGDLVVYGDAGQVRRIFQNLISNSIAYTRGGAIRIGARQQEGTGGVECWVTDTGTGITDSRLITVFEKGEGDPDREDSTGLGLAIVKSFVEMHGGKVIAESEPGQGTTIRFTLPAETMGATGL